GELCGPDRGRRTGAHDLGNRRQVHLLPPDGDDLQELAGPAVDQAEVRPDACFHRGGHRDVTVDDPDLVGLDRDRPAPVELVEQLADLERVPGGGVEQRAQPRTGRYAVTGPDEPGDGG